MTTAGPIRASAAGLVLPHEHLFTDLRGPDKPGYGEADARRRRSLHDDRLRIFDRNDAQHSGVRSCGECDDERQKKKSSEFHASVCGAESSLARDRDAAQVGLENTCRAVEL